MARSFRPHVLGVDDGPFDKRTDAIAPIVGVMMEGHDLVEAVAITEFAVDGDAPAEFLGDWISALRFAAALHAVALSGITIAGLGVIDIERLAARLERPVLVVNRQEPRNDRLEEALGAAGLGQRMAIVERTPTAQRLDDGLYLAQAGISFVEAARLVHACRGKSQLPEPLRLAHLIAGAVASGQSRGGA